MEPILNEHEVIKFLVGKGGRCTNFELVSNFRGVLNDPHCKAEARLRFKDIINTVATVGEFQNVKYIELKKEHGLNNGMDSTSPGYTSPLTQNFQPYWRYRLSTSKQLLPPPPPPSSSSPPRSLPAYRRSVSEYPQGYRTPSEDQVVPDQEEFPSMSSDWESGHSSPFHPKIKEPRPLGDHRRYSADGQMGHQDVRLQQAAYQSLDQPPVGYHYPEHQAYQHQRSGDRSLEQNYGGSSPQPLDHVGQMNVRLSHPGYQYPQRQPHNYQPNQLHGDRHVPLQDSRMHKTDHQYSDSYPAGYHEHAGRQPQYPKQEMARHQQGEDRYTRRHHHPGEQQVGIQNSHKLGPDESRVHRSSSRRYGESMVESHDDVFRTKPEPSIARKIESLHGIHHSSEPAREFCSLPYESPSSYHLSDISPHGRSDLFGTTEDLQTSANLRNVARALFRDPSRSSRRDDVSNPRQSMSGDRNAAHSSNPKQHSQRSHSSPTHAGYMEDGNLYFGPSTNGRQDHRPTTGTHAGPELSSPIRTASTERVGPTNGKQNHTSTNASGPHAGAEHSSPLRAESMERVPTISGGTMDSTSRPVVMSKIRYSPDPGMDYSSSSITRPGDSEPSLVRPSSLSMDHRRGCSSDVSSRASSINNSCSNLDSEKELLSNSRMEPKRSASIPPPLPPERRSDDKSDSRDNEGLESVSCSGGKVKDRVQHFDDMEKRRNTKRTHSPLAPKENRGTIMHKGMGIDDDVSISVIEPKLKREWFVKAAQCDYHALSGLLKKEPKLAAIKDPAMGYTSLHWAAKQGDANVVKLIAGAYKVNPNIRSNGGYTPVHLATLYKHEMIVHLLVHTYGADPSVRDYSGKRADQYPSNYVKVVAGHNTSERRPLKQRSAEPQPKETSVGNSFMRIGSLNLRKSSRKSTVFASVRGSTRNWGSASELRIGGHSMRKKLHKNMIPAHEKIGEKKNDSDSDSTYGFPSKKQN